MAHSPLLRTSMRLRLDIRSVALVNYELALEDISADLRQPPDKENFDDSRWSDVRKAHENKKTRESQQKSREDELVMTIKKEREDQKSSSTRHNVILLRAWGKKTLGNTRSLKQTIARSGFNEWRPPSLSDSLLFEQIEGPPFSYGRASMAEMGILDRRLLHRAISPQYVPKPHFKMERKRLQLKSAEFAEFVAQNASLIPRPQDESSDEGLLSEDSRQDSSDNRGKRKRAGAGKTKKRTRKPPRFVKLYDCKVHDRIHLKAQATTQFSLLQQSIPRVESPALERVGGTSIRRNSTPPAAVENEEDASVRELRVHGILLPTRSPYNEVPEGEEQPLPTFEEAAQYRAWRQRARPFFNDRDRYMQSRVYRERAHDYNILHAAQSLMGFWAKVNA